MRTFIDIGLPSVLKDPLGRDYEAQRIDASGHLYIYRYTAREEIFLRATTPSGAAAPFFKPLSNEDLVPIGGWIEV